MNEPAPARLAALSYALPEELIAQQPAAERSAARLLVVERARARLEHRTIADLVELLRPGDLLVVNDARVIRARVHARRPSGGRLELLLLREVAAGEWEALVRGRVCVTHGDGSVVRATAERIRRERGWTVEAPEYLEIWDLD